jgi:hypothetical protein
LKAEGNRSPHRWVGFDEVSNRHSIYWPCKQTISIEHSIKFDDDWVIFSQTVTLEGELAGNKPDNSAPLAQAILAQNLQIPDPKPLVLVQPTQDHLRADIEPVPETLMPRQTHPRCVWKESDYDKHLCTGEGTTDS